jgi:serine/threonine-protein kinase RsbW
MSDLLLDRNECYCTLSKTSELEHIRHFVSNYATKCGFDSKVSYNIALAVDEACSNLIKHALLYESDHEIQVNIDCNKDDKFVVAISDDTKPFNPLQIESPDMVEYFKKLKIGGLGIHIMKLVMDEIEYIPKSQSQERNILLLIKYLTNNNRAK